MPRQVRKPCSGCGLAAIRHRANPPPPKKTKRRPRQKPKHNHPTTDPLVNPGNPPHCYQTCSKADSTRTHHRMVFLAQSSPGCRSTRPLQIKKATVMLGWASVVALIVAGSFGARAASDRVKIGVLTDMSGAYSAITGKGSA